MDAKRDIFKKILQHVSFEPSVDLFASRLNNKLPHYVACHPDPGTLNVNEFTIPWENFCAFSPFVILENLLQKVISDKSTRIEIAPNLPTQPWYSLLLKLLTDVSVFLSSSKDFLINPTKN